MEIKPLGHHVLIRRERGPKHTQAGLTLPDSMREPGKTGVVVSIGEDAARLRCPYAPGDRVAYSRAVAKLGPDRDLVVVEDFAVVALLARAEAS